MMLGGIAYTGVGMVTFLISDRVQTISIGSVEIGVERIGIRQIADAAIVANDVRFDTSRQLGLVP
jgi:hypothetical protein